MNFIADRHRRGPRIGPSDRGGDQGDAAGRRAVSARPHPRPDRLARLEPSRRSRRRGSSAALAIALFLSPFSGLGFAIVTGLPAWWLAYLALLGRPGRGRHRWNGIRSGACSPGSPPRRRSTIVAPGSSQPDGSYSDFHDRRARSRRPSSICSFPTADRRRGSTPDSAKTSIDWIARLTPAPVRPGLHIRARPLSCRRPRSSRCRSASPALARHCQSCACRARSALLLIVAAAHG